jgi:hypothetical protein
MKYIITSRQKRNAKRLGVKILLSNNKSKKLSVYKHGVKVADIGDIAYWDYDHYRNAYGIAYANERQRLYKLRHQKYRQIKGTRAYYADQILWT